MDTVASATPLVQLANGGDVPTLLQMFLGVKASCAVGEVSAAALLLGGVYLVARRVIKPIAPLVFIATVFLLSGALGMDPTQTDPFRRADAGRYLYGDRLRHHPFHQLGKGGLWPGLRAHYRPHPEIRQLSGRVFPLRSC